MADALALDRLPRPADAPLHTAFELLVRDASDRAPWGLDDPAAAVADLAAWSWRGDLDPALGFAVAASVLGEAHAHRGARPVAMVAVDDPLDSARCLTDVLGHRLAEAEARARRITRDRGVDVLLREVFVPALATNLAALGDAGAQLVRAVFLAESFPEAAEDVMASAAVMLTVTFGCVRTGGGFDAVDPSSRYADRAPHEALRAIARAVATRCAKLGRRDESSGEQPHVTLARAIRAVHAAHAVLPSCDAASAQQIVDQCAGLEARLPTPDGHVAPASPGDLAEALETRDLAMARAAVQGMDPAAVFRALAPFAATTAVARPYAIATTVQTVEALRALGLADASNAGVYVDAALALTVPWRPERDLARTLDAARADSGR